MSNAHGRDHFLRRRRYLDVVMLHVMSPSKSATKIATEVGNNSHRVACAVPDRPQSVNVLLHTLSIRATFEDFEPIHT